MSQNTKSKSAKPRTTPPVSLEQVRNWRVETQNTFAQIHLRLEAFIACLDETGDLSAFRSSFEQQVRARGTAAQPNSAQLPSAAFENEVASQDEQDRLLAIKQQLAERLRSLHGSNSPEAMPQATGAVE